MNVFDSVDFNGAVYSMKRFNCACFDRIVDQTSSRLKKKLQR